MNLTHEVVSRTSINSNGCWIWQGRLGKGGYATLGIYGRKFWVHRLSFELFRGEIPRKLLVCHTCDVPACVNPMHLFVGTCKQNLEDASQKGRMQHGATHIRAKLTEDDVASIRRARQNGDTQQAIADRYGVTRGNVYAILAGKSWRHLPATGSA